MKRADGPTEHRQSCAGDTERIQGQVLINGRATNVSIVRSRVVVGAPPSDGLQPDGSRGDEGGAGSGEGVVVRAPRRRDRARGRVSGRRGRPRVVVPVGDVGDEGDEGDEGNEGNEGCMRPGRYCS